MINDKTILITGGTGSFGKKFTSIIFSKYNPRKIIIYSRDEYKQYVLRQQFKDYNHKIRYFIGDVRDKDRLYRAFEGVNYVVHAAAMKQVPACEYNPMEAIKTNIQGAQNVIDAALDKGVSKVVALSTDKAVNPINLYGATKLASDKLFIAANAYSGLKNTRFSIVRYGNACGSRGSVIPFFKMLADNNATELPITDLRMTRFWITLEEAADLVFKALDESEGGETYIAKIPSFKIVDLATAMAPAAKLREVGIRNGEKLHEIMITEYDSPYTYEYERHYIIYPNFEWWEVKQNLKTRAERVQDVFRYTSDANDEWLSVEELRARLKQIEIVY